jgi:L-alanine-DL-glutamate epimerase-like enolase superfamily enzyme
MRITNVESRVVRVPADEAYVQRGAAPVWDYVLVTVSTDEGISGYSMGFGVFREGTGTAYHIRDVYRDRLIGRDPLDGELLWQELMALTRGAYPLNETIVAVLDVALWDIRGKVASQPIVNLLGRYRSSIPAYASASPRSITPEEVAREVRQVRAAGYQGYKCLITRGADLDIECARAARDAEPGFILMADAGGQYSYLDALRVGRVLGELDFHWFEEPINDYHVELLARLSDQLEVPILATEKTTPLGFLARYVKPPVVDLLRGDVLMKGGITGLRKALATCELFGLSMEIHTTHTPLLDVANLHVSGSVRNSEFVEIFWDPIFAWGLERHPLEIDQRGLVSVPTGPGLGVAIDWDWIDDHTVEVV